MTPPLGKLQAPSLWGKNTVPPHLPSLSLLTIPGPTVLEVFNTLLRQLRLSIDYALTGSYNCITGVSSKIIKEHEERMFQEAVIKTIGGESHSACCRCGLCWWVASHVVGFCFCILG